MAAGVTAAPARRRVRRGHVIGLCLAVLATAAAAAGLVLAGRHHATGRIALVGTERGGAGSVVSAIELSGPDGSSAVTTTGAPLVRAPGQSDLGVAQVSVGSYTTVAAELAGRRLTASVNLNVAETGVTPILVVIDSGALRAYAGNESVNLGLQLASGEATIPPDVVFTDQAGRRVTLSSLHGRVTVVAAFLTHCHESCPVYTAVLADLERTLQARGQADRVAIAEVTIDADRDTPPVLAAYARMTGADWELLTAPAAELRSFWDALHADYQAVPYQGTPPIDWFTGRRETYDVMHSSLAAVLDASGAERFIVQGDPRLGHDLSAPLARLLTPHALSDATSGAHASWSLPDLLDRIDLLLGAPGEDARGPEAAAQAGSPAPAFTLAGLDGARVSLGGQIGRPVIVNFWATWCLPCRRELPLLAHAAQTHPGLGVLAVDEGEDADTVRGFLHDVLGDHRSLTVVLDTGTDVGGEYAVGGLPVSVFVDAGGTVRLVAVGQLDDDRLAQGLAAIHA